MNMIDPQSPRDVLLWVHEYGAHGTHMDSQTDIKRDRHTSSQTETGRHTHTQAHTHTPAYTHMQSHTQTTARTHTQMPKSSPIMNSNPGLSFYS